MKLNFRTALGLVAALCLMQAVHAQEHPILCATNTPCSLGGPSNTYTGDTLHVAGSKLNLDLGQIFGTLETPGLLFGTGEWPNPLRAALYTDVTALFSGCTGDGMQYLGADGACHTASSGGTPGDPVHGVQINSAGSFVGLLPGATGTYGLSWSSLSTDPTLTAVVPLNGAAGTPTSLTLTNATGLPFSGLATGTLTAGTLIVGSGASLGTMGSGTIAATTAAALAATPSQCTGGQFATGVTAAGAANCATPSGSGNVSNVGTPTSGQIAQWTGSTTIQGLAATGSGNAVLATSPTFVTPAVKGSSTGTTTIASANSSATNYTLTLPAATDTVVTLAAAQTLTNKSIAASEVNSGTLAAAQMPALTGDVTTSAGHVATTVAKINGGAVPASAALVATNSSAQPTAVAVGNGLAISSGTLTPAYSINAQTGTTYTVNCTSDASKLLTFTNASAVAVSIPQATGSCGAGFSFDVQTTGAGTATLTPTTSTINGASSLAVAQNRSCTITSDGANYQVSACTALISTSGTGTVTSVGLSMPTGFSVSGSPVTTSGTLSVSYAGPVVGGTRFTASGTGCTPTALTGGATAGTFTLASGPCTAVVITMNGATGLTAPNGWTCTVGDRTLQAAGTWFQKWMESANTTTTATIPIPAAAGTTDVIAFACTGY